MPDKRDDLEEMEDFGSEATNSERIRRMKQLMRQIYQEETTAKPVKLPPIKAKYMILLASFGSILILGTTMMWNFNRFTTAEEHVLSSMGHINDALQRRSNLFRNLINLTLNQAALEQEIFRHTADARAGMVNTPPTAAGGGGAAEGEGSGSPTGPSPSPSLNSASLLSAAGRLLAVAEQHPDLKAATTYQQLMDKMVVSENLIFERRDEYNEKVRLYNTMITNFPWWLMAKITGFKRYPYFVTDIGPDNRLLELSPDTFIRLLPVQTMSPEEHNKKAVAPTPPTPSTKPSIAKPVVSESPTITPPPANVVVPEPEQP
ncbi:MAG: LemA family protein [Magnetococcales bacterium]|nr:LemA family protein [Magnetococcales bacterium]